MLISGFQGSISEQVVSQLSLGEKYIISNTVEGIEKFVEYVKLTCPDKVLLLGMYSGKDQDKLRIETVCTNKFRNKIEGDVLKVLPIPYFLRITEKIKLAKGIGNSWCNLASYKLLSTKPNLQFTFLHIPKNFSVQVVIDELKMQM